MTTGTPRPTARPTSREGLGELAGVVQPLRLAIQLPSLLLQGERGHGRPVLVLPGRGFGDETTLPLRAYLRSKGYRPSGWGLGRNGFTARTATGPLVDLLEARGAREEPWALVGQSMGGHLAREVARRRPDLVDRVVTIGSPVFAPASPGPITRPVTALWSRADRIVDAGWAIDRTPGVDHVEVRSTHLAMGLDPDVWRAVADALAAPPRDAST